MTISLGSAQGSQIISNLMVIRNKIDLNLQMFDDLLVSVKTSATWSFVYYAVTATVLGRMNYFKFQQFEVEDELY